MVDLYYNGQSVTGLTAKNTMGIKYTLASEDNSVIRDLEVDDDGNHFIESAENDLATFFTQYPDTLVDGLYWGKGMDIGGNASDSDYLYTSEDTVTVTNGVAIDDLELERLDMLTVYIIGVAKQGVVLKSISINDIEVAKPNTDLTPDIVSTAVDINLAKYIENYMSYNTESTLDFSVTVNTAYGDITLTESVDLANASEVLLDGTAIQ